jgi:hypothetical protein
MFKKSGKLILKDNKDFLIFNNETGEHYNFTEKLNENVFNTISLCIKDITGGLLFESEDKLEYRKLKPCIYNLYLGEKNLTEILFKNVNKYIEIEFTTINQIYDEAKEGDKKDNESRECKNKENKS